MRQVLNFLCLGFLFSGCSFYQITSEATTFDYYIPKSSASEVQYLESISQPYKFIGSVTVRTERNQEFGQVITKLKKEAAALGADAITNITAINTPPKNKNQRHLLDNANIRTSYTADALVFEPTSAQVK